MKKNYFGLPLTIAAILLSTTVNLQAQVTIGSEIAPTKAALLELKTQQRNATDITSVDDVDNVTSTTGGLLLPRVRLVSTTTMEPFIDPADPEWTSSTNKLKERLAGLMVYNLTTGNGFYRGLWIWDGTNWVTSDVNTSSITYISQQPKAFSFYETGEEPTVDPLVFTASGGESPFAYQWYRIVGNNVHVRVAEPLVEGVLGTGTTLGTFTPSGVLKGTTRNANNTGFYRFYCVAKNAANDSLISDIAEVAVGCGGKTKEGKWLSFMCFNLGADNTSTINSQKTYSITFDPPNDPTTGLHTYVNGEENVYGDLFQWGRIPDGHEKRDSETKAFRSATDTLKTDQIVSGGWCSTTDNQRRPTNQIKQTSSWYGKFISGVSIATNYNWNPTTSQTTVDGLWTAGRYLPNDPCAHYENNGSYHEFWHADGENSGDPACGSSPDNWRLPTQAEWGELYRGGTIFGSPANAEANTWVWHSTLPRGYEIRPDNATTTLFLPASGDRHYGTAALLYYQGSNAHYWSSTVAGTNAYVLYFYSGSVNPATTANRSYGYPLRCIKH